MLFRSEGVFEFGFSIASSHRFLPPPDIGGGRLLFFQSVFNCLLHIMHLFPSDRRFLILFVKNLRVHESFITPFPQKMRGTLSPTIDPEWGIVSEIGVQYQPGRRLSSFPKNTATFTGNLFIQFLPVRAGVGNRTSQFALRAINGVIAALITSLRSPSVVAKS